LVAVIDPVGHAGQDSGAQGGRAAMAWQSAPGVTWRKSSWSAYNGSCVEVAELGAEQIGVRDSKAGLDSPVLVFGHAEWASFLRGLKR
jgi:hypothetical protein